MDERARRAPRDRGLRLLRGLLSRGRPVRARARRAAGAAHPRAGFSAGRRRGRRSAVAALALAAAAGRALDEWRPGESGSPPVDVRPRRSTAELRPAGRALVLSLLR